MEHSHGGHRARLKRRFLDEDLDHFQPHEILELILFYVIPQQDTNPLAHRLLETFGTLAAVFDAPIEQLMTVPGIKENAATYIKMFPSVFRMYEQSSNAKSVCYDNYKALEKFAKSKFVGITNEQCYVVLFNNRMQMIECTLLAEGTTNRALVLPRPIIERAMIRRASSILLMHNHPNGTAVPSQNDRYFTQVIDNLCQYMDIRLLDHLVVAGDQITSITRTEKMNGIASPTIGVSSPGSFEEILSGIDFNKLGDLWSN